MINRLLYFGYYLKKMDWDRLTKFQQYLIKNYQIGKLRQWGFVLYHSMKYNISILEYYQFRFFEKSHTEKLTWAGTGHMYEYQKIMNPLSKRGILDDKRDFFTHYKEFFVHQVFSLIELESDTSKIHFLYFAQKLVFKVSNGKCGISVQIVPASQIKKQEILSYMRDKGFDMVETFIEQHAELNRLSPTAVNTVRIFTQLTKANQVEILGCRQRISINSHVDNMAAGNVAASINEDSGIIDGPGYYSDITKTPITVHPITKVQIVGFQVPFWKECLDLARRAALKHPQNRSVGWDIVVTENGPGLIEGNHDWCKLVWQLPVDQGLKHLLKSSA